jgi:hypothetical protein
MKQTPDDQPLTPADPFALTQEELDRLEKLVQAGAEPFWMQDIRLAQRAIDAERARLRAAQSGGEVDE